METHTKSIRNLNFLLLGLFLTNFIYLFVAKDTISFELYHRESLVVLLMIWIPLNALYLFELRKLRSIKMVRWGLIPFNVLSLLFFSLIASNFSQGVSGTECNGFFFLYFLFNLFLHVLSGAIARKHLTALKIKNIVRRCLLASVSLSILISSYLYVQYFSSFLLQSSIMCLVFSVAIFLVSIPLVFGFIQLFPGRKVNYSEFNS
jgi:hypothetical protein